MECKNKDLKDKLLDLLLEFDRICKKNDIKYSLAYGTLLGAVRHDGFIPWDDDIDVFLLRKDYDKLKEIGTKSNKNNRDDNSLLFHSPYFFQNPSTDKGFPKGFCRLRNSSTAYIPFQDVAMKCNRGIFIDIFPIDNVPNSDRKLKNQIKKLRLIRLVMNSYARYYSGFGAMNTTQIKKILYYISLPIFKSKLLTMQKLYKLYERVASKYKDKDTKRIGVITDNNGGIWQKNIFLEGYDNHIFESNYFPIFKNTDNILKEIYGNDYMTPQKLPNGHGESLISTTIPYEEFYKLNKDYLISQWKKITEVPD